MRRKKNSNTTEETNERDDLIDLIRALSTEVTKLNGQIAGRKQVIALTDDIARLKEEVTELQIARSKLDEEYARKERETEHKVGLAKDQFDAEKKQHEKEFELSKREALLEVQRTNLAEDKRRFEEHIEFVENETREHMADIRGLLEQVMERIPVVSVGVKQTITEKNDGGTNGTVSTRRRTTTRR